MCFKKWFKPDLIVPPIPTNKRALLFGINNYGGGNNLNGCLNDVDDVEKKLNKEFPGFVIEKYKDSIVTCNNFYNTIKNAIVIMRPGDLLYIHYSGHGTQIPSAQEANGYHEALYLFDGPFIDDKIQDLFALIPAGAKVIAKFDSCFSGDMLRDLKLGIDRIYTKNRFFQLPGVPVLHKAVGRFAKSVPLNCLVISGCGEEQTSADAYISGRYNGAFTFFDNKSYGPGMTYSNEMTMLHTYLPGSGFDQNPTIDGDVNLFNQIIFT